MIIGPKTTLILQGVTEAADGYGGFTETWTDLYTFIGVFTAPSRLVDIRFGETFLGGKMTEQITHIFYCEVPPNITVTQKHRLKTQSATAIYNIVGVRNPGLMNHHLEILLKEVR